MKTINTVAAMISESLENYRTTAAAIREAVKTLESIQAENIDKTPADTVAAYVAAVGHDMAVCIVASLINRCAWDGRISSRCAQWASAQDNAWDKTAAERLWIYTDRVHLAHLNQIAAAMMEYKPSEPETTTAAETIATVTAPVQIHISAGNAKLGKIPNFSLVPGRTCSAKACKTCLKQGCYALKSYRLYPSVKKSWDENTAAAVENLPALEAELNRYFSGMNAPRFFRLHVAGDFVSREYAEMWARVMENAPHTNFLAFTKQFDTIRGVQFPANASVVLSAWPGCDIPADLRDLYSVAWLDDGTDARIPADAIPCPGNCEHCGACWGLAQRKMDVCFAKH